MWIGVPSQKQGSPDNFSFKEKLKVDVFLFSFNSFFRNTIHANFRFEMLLIKNDNHAMPNIKLAYQISFKKLAFVPKIWDLDLDFYWLQPIIVSIFDSLENM